MSDNIFDTLRAGFAPRLDRAFLRSPDGTSHTDRAITERSGRLAWAHREHRSVYAAGERGR